MKTLSLIVLLLLQSVGLCQAESVALVTNNDGSTGSCVVIERTNRLSDGWVGLAVTAYHVVEHQASVKVTYFNGRRALGCHTLAVDKDADLAIIRVWIPDEAEPVEIATDQPDGELLLLGYPNLKFDTLRGRFLRVHGPRMYLDSLVRPGFSGGGVFHGKRLVGCISGGWFWLQDEDGRQSTWPTRAGNGAAITALVVKAKQVPVTAP